MMATRLATAVLGILLAAMGLVTVEDEPFLGWLDVSLGILTLLSIMGSTRNGRYASAIGPVALGGGALALWILALALHAGSTLTWWTLAIGMALLVLGVPELRRDRL